jgi:hypothetical protein
MSATQNLIYATVQAAHNFGAVAAVGGSLAGAVLRNSEVRKNLARITLGGWGTQAISGATFGAVSYYYYHKFPDIGEIATTALMIKMGCVAIGFILLAAYLVWGANWAERKRNGVWHASLLLAVTALSAAAVLRWFS